ncbi:MAG TPA: hypothetical protein VF103_12755 [Polyangiaceae bacterium]
MSQKPFDPFRYNADTVPPFLRKHLARLAVPELSPAELEPPPDLKPRLASLSGAASRRVAPAVPRTRRNRKASWRRVGMALILLCVTGIFATAFAWLKR